jgi:predicted transcriptional regulator
MKVIMNLQAKKLELVQLILNTEEPSILARVEAVFKKDKDDDWWDETSEAEKKAIENGITEADSGRLIPHSRVMEEIREKYNLNK